MKHLNVTRQVINPDWKGLVIHRKRVLRSGQRCRHEASTSLTTTQNSLSVDD